jgi:hypothetical protein
MRNHPNAERCNELRIVRQLRQIPFPQQFVDPSSGRIKLKGSESKLVVVRFAPLYELEEFLGILVFDQVGKCIQRTSAR